jgi:GNAT superfamily N-acetyltransferase
VIRPAIDADIPRLNEIRLAVRENRLGDPSWLTEERVREALRPPGAGWVWEEAGRVLGFCVVSGEDDSIWALFVDPNAEGRGGGSALLDRAMEWMKESGADTVRLSTDPDTRAERFYRSRGWQPSGVNDRGEVVLEYRLSGERLLALHNELDALDQKSASLGVVVIFAVAATLLLALAVDRSSLYLALNGLLMGGVAGFFGTKDLRRALRKQDLRKAIASVEAQDPKRLSVPQD